MDYNRQEGLLKENSLGARIYFLLLKRQASYSEISRVIYGDKVQLSNVQKVVEKLVKEGYVQEIVLSKLEKEELGMSKIATPYKSTYKPVLEFIDKKVAERNQTSKEKDREPLTAEDKKVLELIFQSKWFSKFYSEEFLKTQRGEVMKEKNGEIVSPCPIRFFALFLEELFAIGWLLQESSRFRITNKDILDCGNFDLLLEQNKKRFGTGTLKQLHKINSLASDGLGRVEKFDYYTEDIGILLLPLPLAKKLRSIGRVPLTVAIFFKEAIKRVLKNKRL